MVPMVAEQRSLAGCLTEIFRVQLTWGHRRHGVSGLDRIPGGELHLIPFDNVATLACSWCTVARICFEGLNYILCARMWSECQHSRYHPFDRNGVPLLSRSGRCFCASARSGNFAPQAL